MACGDDSYSSSVLVAVLCDTWSGETASAKAGVAVFAAHGGEGGLGFGCGRVPSELVRSHLKSSAWSLWFGLEPTPLRGKPIPPSALVVVR